MELNMTTKHKPTKIKTVKALKKAIENEENDFFLVVGGFARSSKTIFLTEDNKFDITNEIDDSEQTLTEDELFDETLTNIGKAMKLGAFYKY